jgi:hypothetical protein
MQFETKPLQARRLEGADRQMALAVVLDVEERIADSERHLVPKLG